ncbi:MAG: hypothetical protein ACRD3S_22015, partial [Terracidiphilus sp.]
SLVCFRARFSFHQSPEKRDSRNVALGLDQMYGLPTTRPTFARVYLHSPNGLASPARRACRLELFYC